MSSPGFVNAFPPLGEVRVWSEHYINYVANDLPDLNWERFGKLRAIQLQTTPKCSGLYMFVWGNSQARLTPFKTGIPTVVYVGRSENIQARIKSYIDDFCSIKQFRSSERKIRDSIKVMLKEYGASLEIFYCIIEPSKITHYEDVLIKIFDPIFNTEQRLKRENFEEFERVYVGRISFSGKEEEKINEDENNNDGKMKNIKNSNESMRSTFGDPKSAF